MNDLTRQNTEPRGAAVAALLRQNIRKAYADNGRAERFISYLEEHDMSLVEALPAYREALLKRYRAHDISAKTFNGYMDAVAERITFALDNSPSLTEAEKYTLEKLKKQSVKRVKINSIAVPESKVLTYDEIRTLIAGIPRFQPHRKDGSPVELTDKDRHELLVTALMVEFMSYTAVRVSEMLNVMDKDIKPINAHYEIRIVGKGDKERRIKVEKGMVDRIRETCGDVYLFQKQNGKQYRREVVSMRIKRYAEAIIGRPVSAHCLRHSWATHANKKTGNVKAIQLQLGHSSPATTLALYVHGGFTFEEQQELFK